MKKKIKNKKTKCHVLETEQILVSHRQSYYRYYYSVYRECYDIKRNVGILYIFFNLEFCFKLRLSSRDNSWFWYRREL